MVWPGDSDRRRPRRVAVLGSTGSIGTQSLDVIEHLGGIDVCALAAGSNADLLARQVDTWQPELAGLVCCGQAEVPKLPAGTELLRGSDCLVEMIRRSKPDLVINGIVGAAGLAPTIAAIEIGADIAIANKETLVCAGAVVMPAAAEAGVNIFPIDSEHSGLLQCLSGWQPHHIRQVVLTASGGALRDWDDDAAAAATVDQALNHPTWQMGPKITVDSATLINKALEVIEAHWLFDLPAEKIAVVIHPESIIHAMVEFVDDSVVAQMGQPDMRTPISLALTWPDRIERSGKRLDLAELASLTFRRPEGRFAEAIELAYDVIGTGGLSGAVLNAANEVAVRAFLDGQLRFGQILPIVKDVLNRTPESEELTLERLAEADRWARREVCAALDAQTGTLTEHNHGT
ncbi:MAG: 1-deoxy-D-xylulose-5-phosphate reductoisomerase [Phycisphaerae bacterium]